MYYEVSESSINKIKENIEAKRSENLNEKYLAKNSFGEYVALNCGERIVTFGLFKTKAEAIRFLED